MCVFMTGCIYVCIQERHSLAPAGVLSVTVAPPSSNRMRDESIDSQRSDSQHTSSKVRG